MFNSSPNKSKIITKGVENKIVKSKLNNSFSSAIKYDRIEELKLLVKKSADVNEPGRNKVTPLHVAAKHGRFTMMKFLIENGAFLDSTLVGPKERRFSPLHLAVLGNHVECVELLLQCGASVSPKIDVCHPIHLAVFKNAVEIVNLLLDYGADVNLRFYNNFFKAFECTMHRHLWLDHTLPLLHYSILLKFDKMTDLLLSRGADVNIKTSLWKTTLMQAVEVQNIDLVEKKNANVNDRDVFGQPVLHFTVANGKRKAFICNAVEDVLFFRKYKVVKILVENGADVNARFPANKEKTSVINYVIKYGYSSAARFLLHDTNFDFNEINLETFYSGEIFDQAMTDDISDDFVYVNTFQAQLQIIIFYILEKAISLRMIGLLVDEKILLEYPSNDCFSITWYTHHINSLKDKFMQEVNYVKETKINNSNITIWYLLTCKMKDLVRLMSNEKFQGFDIHQYSECAEMSYYFRVLKERINYAKNRKILLRKSTEFISELFINYLPYDCCEKIVNCLSNRELNLFCLQNRQ